MRLTLALFLSAASAGPTGSVVYIYETTDVDLYRGMSNAQRYKSIFLLADEYAWAAYFAGRESVYQEQLNELHSRLK